MRPDCDHWRDCGVTWGGCCAISKRNKPSFGTCNKCPENRRSGQSLTLPDSNVIQVRVPTAEEQAKAKAASDEASRHIWRTIHSEAAAGMLTDARLDGILLLLPCGSCLDHFKPIRAADPLPTNPAEQLPCTWRWHQAVNAHLGKPGITLAEARELYRDATSATG